MILCKAVLESGDFYIDPDYVVALLECLDHDGDPTCKLFLPSGGAVEVFDDEREVSTAIRLWKEARE